MGTVTCLRKAAPAHYTLKIESFSSLLNRKTKKYESSSFEAAGYKWRLCLYPSGNETTCKSHISMYLAIERENLPSGWEVNVYFKMFVFDIKKDKYLTVQDANDKVCRFHDLNTEYGFEELISLEELNKASNGYLVNDTCAFGVEVFQVKYSGKGEHVSLIEDPMDGPYTWMTNYVCDMDDGENCSQEFDVGNHKWKLSLYPNGDRRPRGKYLSLYLKLADSENLHPGRKLYVDFKLRIKKQKTTDEYYEKEGSPAWFSASSNSHGFKDFLLVDDLDRHLGLTVEGQITVISYARDFS